MYKVECIVIGAGVVGLAIARALALRGREVVILEKNPMIGNETSSRNNEVVHAGFLYPPDSLRGTLCRPGAEMLRDYCRERGIGLAVHGKLMLALTEDEEGLLETMMAFGEDNGVQGLQLLSAEGVKEREPEITCRMALYSPNTAVVNSHDYMLSLQGDAENAGAVLSLNSTVVGGQGKVLTVEDENGEPSELAWDTLINASGLGARDIANYHASDREPLPPDIRYAKGSYFTLTGKLPFSYIVVPLGETLAAGGSFTIDPGGQGKFGPDLEWVTEHDYTVDPTKASSFAAAVGKYWNGLDVDRLQPGYAGIRPRAYGPEDPGGDWLIETEVEHGVSGLVNLLGIETPGLTASMAIGDYVAGQLIH